MTKHAPKEELNSFKKTNLVDDAKTSRDLEHEDKATGKENQEGRTPLSNNAQNKQFEAATRGLSKSEKREVHDEITGQGLGFDEICEIADATRKPDAWERCSPFRVSDT